MKKPTPKTITVIDIHALSPNILRISFQSEALKHFPEDSEGGYFKFLFDEEGQVLVGPLKDNAKPKMRTYTIRNLELLSGKMDVDFVTHVTDDKMCGFGARWAMSAEVGDTISIVGPGKVQEVNLDKDWFFFSADMTSLPTLAAKLEKLPSHVKGYAVIQATDSRDQQSVRAPDGIKVIWTTESLSTVSMQQPWLDGEPFVWCACEFDEMRALRQYFRNEKEVNRQDIYISSYWKRGVAEDGHKVIKKRDHDEFENTK
ncbi:siderophore-interacting protein [Vibrio hangzhouensis]|uniref:NADPH-dependent ferric siderophore reductase, contains FAD-binding and SIP domains n=1 Tax=Vibrio hangzhouensis TaxID=462991 RepID=A0A1H5YLV4_9VIBR|nr:siderophore-interacting protein [Vibrio hangzhouensis]SEG24622.1 NADPH-dependent ferric siderophore reductase, contains FAD-binding and SIP domains [Vibrio hangzhouensis]